MNVELLRELAQHQVWADAEHWKTLQANPKLLEDAEICRRLNHMFSTCEMLQMLARGETPDVAKLKALESRSELEAAMASANQRLADMIGGMDLEKSIALPRGPKGPFEAPAGILLLQALMHSQHHRGQNASRMRELGVTPPMTDFVIWYALGRP